MTQRKSTVGAIVFKDFELLDLFGPLEMFGALKDQIEIVIVAEEDKIVQSAQGPKIVADFTFADCPTIDILLIPGGLGTRTEVNNAPCIDFIEQRSKEANYVATVCTGAALLAKTGLLDHHKATTNKNAFDWVASQNSQVDWVAKARWVEDDRFFTSSGISAGLDMTLALIEKMFDKETSMRVAQWTEYVWNTDPDLDPFWANRNTDFSPSGQGLG
jgi:transcriptional regulator GlxA family with amidase domain